MSLQMEVEEREAFLTGVHVGILSVEEPGRGPLTVPIWYAYESGGELWVVTGRHSRKGRLLQHAKRFSLCVQSEAPPYKYVSVEGPVSKLEPSEIERDERPLAHRYLGADLGDQYIEATGGAEARDNIRIAMRPERWLTVDYAKELSLPE